METGFQSWNLFSAKKSRFSVCHGVPWVCIFARCIPFLVTRGQSSMAKACSALSAHAWGPMRSRRMPGVLGACPLHSRRMPSAHAWVPRRPRRARRIPGVLGALGACLIACLCVSLSGPLPVCPEDSKVHRYIVGTGGGYSDARSYVARSSSSAGGHGSTSLLRRDVTVVSRWRRPFSGRKNKDAHLIPYKRVQCIPRFKKGCWMRS